MEASTIVSESLTGTHQNGAMAGLEDLSALSLAVPLESTKYSFMSMLLARALNLKDESLILDPASYRTKKRTSPVEILPHIAVPGDLWLASDIGIKESKVKIALLEDVNAMLTRSIGGVGSMEFLLDEELITSFENRVLEHSWTSFSPVSSSSNSLREDDEIELEDASESNSPKVSPVDTDIASISSASSRPASVSARSTSRKSSLSREFIQAKRKLSFFGHQGNKSESLFLNEDRKSYISQTPMSSPGFISPDFGSYSHSITQKASQINGLLSKSKFYNKLVKRRDSVSTQGSTNMASTTFSPSYRNSNGYEPQEVASYKRSYQINATQRIENQKEKYRFYAQVKALGENIQVLAANFGRRGSQADLVSLMEFIKNYIFKFVVVELCHMIVQKAQMGVARDLQL